MDDLNIDPKVIELNQQGFSCAQIILMQGLQIMGKENPDLIRSMEALAGGIGYTGDICGALTGGACLLGLYAGKGEASDRDDPRLLFMIEDLVKWFKSEYGEKYDGIRCDQILSEPNQQKMIRCPIMIDGVIQKVKELLVENGFDLSGLDE